jgi:Zn-dependent protease/CBS domain-containing protein
MQAHIQLGRILGIPIGLHFSWIIIATLITLALANHFRLGNPEWGAGLVWGSALVTAVLFFTSIVVHELSHAVVARARGLPVRSITLFALGGVAQIEKEANRPSTEFFVGIIGPITSVVIGLLCLGTAQALGWAPPEDAPGTPAVAILVWLGFINILLAGFNMLPGFPLDGGRVLRAIIWGITGDGDRSTRIAARVGQGVALGFIFLGLWAFFGMGAFGGLWLAIIGWFLFEAARTTYVQSQVLAGLRGVRVRDMMSECPSVDARLPLQAFVDDQLLRTGRRCFIAERDGRVVGLITPTEVKTIERARWPQTIVEEAMRPLQQLRTVRPDADATEALMVMSREDINQLPVVSDGHLEGVISRGHILRYLQAREELNV